MTCSSQESQSQSSGHITSVTCSTGVSTEDRSYKSRLETRIIVEFRRWLTDQDVQNYTNTRW